MRDLFEIQSAAGAHPVRIADASVPDVVDACQGSIVLADNFFRDVLEDCDCPVVFVEATEEAKDFANIAPLIEQCRQHGLARNGHIIAIGGGVVQDITGFIATVYMRGVKWTLLPTTLLAMVDSCIGGKSSINVGAFKNLVGSFYPPSAIVVPLKAVETLPAEHISAGQCEVAKICFAHSDKAFYDYISLSHGTLQQNPGDLVELSLRSKKWFVEVDEFDQNERLLLNFGHSFGHALESCTDYLVTHGVAVGVGCLSAIALSAAGRPEINEIPRVRALADKLHSILADVDGLLHALATIDRVEFFRFWRSDKKHNTVAYRPILIDQDGFLYRATLDRNEATDDAIWQGFQSAVEAIIANAPTRASGPRNPRSEQD